MGVERLQKLFDDLLYVFGYTIRSAGVTKKTESLGRITTLLHILSESPKTSQLSLADAMALVGKAKSQLGQDVLALSTKGIEVGGFFVEFGATNGVTLSNTHILEKEFGWSGILCEPAKQWQDELQANRRARIDTRCVYSSSDELVAFSETSIKELSTISSFLKSDSNKFLRKPVSTYLVPTVSLFDLLSHYGAPQHIDFLSIDTEGSEYEILRNFDLDKYTFGLICVEHNFSANRAKVRDLLVGKGYKQVYPELSDFDDWFVLGGEN